MGLDVDLHRVSVGGERREKVYSLSPRSANIREYEKERRSSKGGQEGAAST